jgi:predicted transcriptional regulator with HTH domain
VEIIASLISSHYKLLERFLKLPKDFTWDELKRLVKRYGYFQNNKGKTSGSRIKFEKEDSEIYLDLHKLHPKNILKPYQMKDVLDFLKRIEMVKEESDK